MLWKRRNGNCRNGLPWTCVFLFVLVGPLNAADVTPQGTGKVLVQELYEMAAVEGGLVLHIGCGNGRLTAALCADDSYLVHGVDSSVQNVETARAYIRSQELLGHGVSIAGFDGKQLPIIDNLVNLVVAEDLGGVALGEVMRTLRPGGVAAIKRQGKWTKTVKPRPANIDQWTHFLHGPDGNAVARDDVVGFPNYIQWVGSPKHSRHHGFATSMDVMVSAGGRIFYIFDEGPTAIPRRLPSRWYLIARDAFNGVVLWKRPLSNWRPYQVKGRKSLAADLWRRMVATDDELYVTKTIFGPVVAIDPATGKTIRTYAGTEKTEEIIHQDGVLYLVATTSDPENIDRRQLATRRTQPDGKRIMAVDTSSGALLWAKEDDDTQAVHPLTLAVKAERLFFQNTSEVICLDAKNGDDIWRYARASDYSRPGYATPTLVVHDDVVLSADRLTRQAINERNINKRKSGGSELIALSAGQGDELWRCMCGENVGAAVDVFVADGLVWVGENRRRGASDYNHGRDLYTGEIKRKFAHAGNWPTWHHHRCYRDKATENYILAGRTGIEFVDLDSGKLTTHHWTRGICEYGILPCNGLIYSPPDQCGCYIESKLHGFHALASQRQSEPTPLPATNRLECGPAYGNIRAGGRGAHGPEAWPTLRYDNSRSNYTRAEIPRALKTAWNANLGGTLTSPVCADGRLYVAREETHTVFCLDADTGQVQWRYEAGGRVDSPPSIANGMTVFGSHDGWVYALRASDGKLVWRFLAAPNRRCLVERNQVASVWPVHGSVLIDSGNVYFAAGRSSYLDGGMYLYKLALETGKTLCAEHFTSRDPETGQRISLFTPYESEVLPFREYPGLLPDVLSCDGDNLYMRAVPFSRELVIQDQKYVPHLFSSMGFLEDSWWERSYWIYGSHFYGGARGHGYARTRFPAGRILTFDEESVYGYRDATIVNSGEPGIFRVAKTPKQVDLWEKLPNRIKKSGDFSKKDVAQYVWKDGVPQDAKQMELTANGSKLKDAIRKMLKYEYSWRHPLPIHPQAMLLTPTTFFIAGSAEFDDEATSEYLATNRTDRFQLTPFLQNALDTFEGRKGGLLCAVDKKDGRELARLKLPSTPVFDGMIAADGKLFVALKNGCVVCMQDK